MPVATRCRRKPAGFWRSRCRWALGPVDRRLCVATFRWFCLYLNRVMSNRSLVRLPPMTNDTFCCWNPLPCSASGGRQEIDRIQDRDRPDPLLGAEVEPAHAIDHLGRELRRVHVRPAQLAQRDAAVRLDLEAQDHLALQVRIA